MTAIAAEVPTGLVDELIAFYCNWRTECAVVRAAYEHFSGASKTDRGLAFAAYEAALDREQSAADTYASQVDLVTSLCATRAAA